MHRLISIVVLALCMGAYVTPSMIAQRTMRRQAARILLLNVALGWIKAGWPRALAWATKSSATGSRRFANAARRRRRLLMSKLGKEIC
jgi:T4 superinfection immunity protein